MAPFRTPPPDPNPKKPKLKLPKGSIDTHVHLFGPAGKYAFDPNSLYYSDDALPETQIAMQDLFGLSMSVIVSGGGYGANYTHLADTLARFPDRFRGVALLPETTPSAEIARLDRLGVRGCRFAAAAHAHLPGFSTAMAARVHEFGWHVQYYPHGTEIIDVGDRLLSLPNEIVLDHFASIPSEGGINQPAFVKVLKMLDTGRVWMKISGPMRLTREEYPYPSVIPMARKLVEHRPDRMVWGSDWPHVNLDGRTIPNDGDLVDLIAEWVPDEATRKRILVDNPRKLYKIA